MKRSGDHWPILRCFSACARRRWYDGLAAGSACGWPRAGRGRGIHGGGGQAYVELAPDQGVRHGVVVALDLDVVVDVDPRLLPLGEHIVIGRKGSKRRGGRGCSNSERRDPGSLRKGRALSRSSSFAIAALSSTREKNVRWRSAARISARPPAPPPRPWPCRGASSPVPGARPPRSGRPGRGRWGWCRARSGAPGSPPNEGCLE